jgi:hypothetical protein
MIVTLKISEWKRDELRYHYYDVAVELPPETEWNFNDVNGWRDGRYTYCSSTATEIIDRKEFKNKTTFTYRWHTFGKVQETGQWEYIYTATQTSDRSKFFVISGPKNGEYTADPGEDYATVNRAGRNNLLPKVMWVYVPHVQEIVNATVGLDD